MTLIVGVALEFFPIYCLISLATIPLVINSGMKLKSSYNDIEKLVPVMNSTLIFSRITGALFVIGFLLNI